MRDKEEYTVSARNVSGDSKNKKELVSNANPRSSPEAILGITVICTIKSIYTFSLAKILFLVAAQMSFKVV